VSARFYLISKSFGDVVWSNKNHVMHSQLYLYAFIVTLFRNWKQITWQL